MLNHQIASSLTLDDEDAFGSGNGLRNQSEVGLGLRPGSTEGEAQL